MTLKFTPSATGTRNTSVFVNTTTPAANDVFGVQGLGIEPGIDVTPASNDFGNVDVGHQGNAKTFSIKSDGATDLETSLSFTGANAGDFFFSPQPDRSYIPVDSTCQVTVNVLPTGSAGARSANLVISNNTKSENPVTIPLTATATAPHFSTEPIGLGFGQFDLFDDPPATKSLTIKSDGTAALQINGMVLDPSIANSNAFSLDQGECVDALVMAPGEDCTLDVTFKASSFDPGIYNTKLLVFTNTGEQSVTLSAARVSGGTSTDSSVDFGDVELGHTGSETLTLTSTGSAALKMSPPAIDGPNAEMFSVEQPSDCNGLMNGQSCEVTVHFTPSSLAGKQASLTLSGNFGSTGVSLTGSGTQAYLNVPGDITFPETILGNEVTYDETLLSNGSAPFSLSSLTIEGPDASMFSLEPPANCVNVAHGDACAYSVSYKPTATGSHEAQLKITGNVEGGSQTIPLYGSARNLTPAKVSLKLSAPKKAWRGGNVTLTAKVSKSGEQPTGPLELKTVVPKKLASAVKSIRIPALGAGDRIIVKTIKIKVKKAAKKAGKLKVKVSVSSSGIKAAPATAIWRMRKRPELLYQS